MNLKTHIKMKDGISSHDSIHTGLRGEIIFGKGLKKVPFIDPYGNKSYRTEFDEVIDKQSNIVPIGGYQFTFNKLFNIPLDQESTLRVGDLNGESPQMKFGVNMAEYSSSYYNAEISTDNSEVHTNAGVNISAMNFIFGFMIGDGGSMEDNITPIAPDYKRRNLFRPIPFRMSNDGNDMTAGKYYAKTSTFDTDNPVTSYYVKKFDNPPPRIIHAWVTDNDDELSLVDDTVFASTSSIPIESYVEMNLYVDSKDCRGYFTSTSSTPRVNEFGLVTGWYNAIKDDYESIRLFTHFTRPSISLADGDEVVAIYRLYAR